MYYDIAETKFGPFIAAWDNEGLRHLNYQDGKRVLPIAESWRRDKNGCKPIFVQLAAYCAGEIKIFDLPLAPSGTPFMKSVWDLLITIPYGETTSYGEIAGRLGNPGASRAVGMANSKNPIQIIIPCHRVTGKNGKLTGYAGGLKLKEDLLRLEGLEDIIY